MRCSVNSVLLVMALSLMNNPVCLLEPLSASQSIDSRSLVYHSVSSLSSCPRHTKYSVVYLCVLPSRPTVHPVSSDRSSDPRGHDNILFASIPNQQHHSLQIGFQFLWYQYCGTISSKHLYLLASSAH